MAVRFIQPVDTPYESQFIPMPLEFMQQNLETKQKGLDTARTQLGTADFKIDNTPWDAENAQTYRDEFVRTISELTSNLEQNKGSYGQTVSQLGALNRKFNTDPELNRIRKHYELYKTNVAPYLGKPNAESLYFRNLMEQDPTTGEWGWRGPSQISEKDIRTPIEDRVEETISTELLSFLKPSIKEKYGEGQFSYDEKGDLIWVTPAGEKVTDLNLDNPFTQGAINAYTQRILEGTADQYLYIKEFKGLNSFEDIKNLVTGIASKGFYRNEDVTLGGATNVPGGGSRGPGSDEDDNYSLEMVSTGASTRDVDFAKNLTVAQEIEDESYINLLTDVSTRVTNAMTNPGYAPLLREAFTGSFEERADELLIKKYEEVKDSNPELAARLQQAYNLPDTFVEMMSNPYDYFKEGGRLENQYGFNRDEVESLQTEMLQTIVDLKQNPNIGTGDLDVVNGILSNYSTFKQASEKAERLETIFTEAAKQSGLADETVKESFRMIDLIHKVTGLNRKDLMDRYRYSNNYAYADLLYLEYSDDEMQNSEELRELARLGALQKEDNKWKFIVKEKTNDGRTVYIMPESLKTVVNATSDFNQAVEKLQSKSESERLGVREISVGGSGKKGAVGNFLNNLKEKYNDNPNLLLVDLQKAAGGDGKDERNNSLEKIFADRGLGDNPKVTAAYINANSSGQATNLIVVTDEDGKTATFETLIDTEAPAFREVIIQMSKDSDARVRDASYLLRTNLMFNESELGTLDIAYDTMFTLDPTNMQSITVPIKDTRGYEYIFTRTSQATIKVNVTAPNGEVIEISSIRNAQGKVLDPTNIKNADDARTYLGYVGTLLAGGQGGSSSSVGKQRPQAGDRR
jgi:hypothetical protein